MALAGYSMTSAPQFIGCELGCSDWLTVDQAASTSSPPAPAITSGSTSMLSAPRRESPLARRSRTVHKADIPSCTAHVRFQG